MGLKGLQGKICVVTGASRGIGRGIAIRMAEEGSNVVVNYSSHKREAEEVADMINKHNQEACLVQGDVSKKADVELLGQRAIDTFGRIDILVNNAGIFNLTPSLDLTEDSWDRTIDVNLKGTFLCSQILGKKMIERRKGAIVNMSSVIAHTPFPYRLAYCASKCGVEGLTKTLAIEWAQFNVRVNCVAPAYVETERLKAEVKAGTRDMSKIRDRTPMKRLAEPSEIAAAVAFLASDDASYVTGETIIVDGGWSSYGYISLPPQGIDTQYSSESR